MAGGEFKDTLGRWQKRNGEAAREEWRRLLDEAQKMTRYHRKTLIARLDEPHEDAQARPRRRPGDRRISRRH